MKRKRDDATQGKPEDQEIYDLIDKRDWKSALELLEPEGPRCIRSQDYLRRKIGTRLYTPFAAVLRSTIGEIEPSARALCLRLIDVGGSEMLERAWYGTTLHVLFAWRRSVIPLELLDKLIEVGGPKLILKRDENGGTALHVLCTMFSHLNGTLLPVFDRLISVGGKSQVLMEDWDGSTPLHRACKKRQLNVELIKRLVDVGRQEIVLRVDKQNRTPMQIEVEKDEPCQEVIDRFIEIGGENLLG